MQQLQQLVASKFTSEQKLFDLVFAHRREADEIKSAYDVVVLRYRQDIAKMTANVKDAGAKNKVMQRELRTVKWNYDKLREQHEAKLGALEAFEKREEGRDARNKELRNTVASLERKEDEHIKMQDTLKRKENKIAGLEEKLAESETARKKAGQRLSYFDDAYQRGKSETID